MEFRAAVNVAFVSVTLLLSVSLLSVPASPFPAAADAMLRLEVRDGNGVRRRPQDPVIVGRPGVVQDVEDGPIGDGVPFVGDSGNVAEQLQQGERRPIPLIPVAVSGGKLFLTSFDGNEGGGERIISGQNKRQKRNKQLVRPAPGASHTAGFGTARKTPPSLQQVTREQPLHGQLGGAVNFHAYDSSTTKAAVSVPLASTSRRPLTTTTTTPAVAPTRCPTPTPPRAGSGQQDSRDKNDGKPGGGPCVFAIINPPSKCPAGTYADYKGDCVAGVDFGL